jgi:uncharacterized protein (DUF433 family)
MPVTEPLSHVIRDEKGVAWIDQANVKVIEVARDHLAYGWSAEALHEQYPHLSLAQLHSALAYFYDHQAELEDEIRDRQRLVDETRDELGDSPLQRRLQQLKLER